jgi:uncharacterized protein YxeA
MKKILMALAAVAVLGVGGWFGYQTLQDKPQDTANSAATQNTTNTNTTDGEENLEGSLETFRSAGKARKCSLSYSGENGNGSGTMYTDGKGRGRITLDVATEKGNTGESNTLVLSEKSYSWTKTDSGTFGLAFNTSDIKTDSQSSNTSTQQSADKNFSMKCKSWSVEESVLTVPSDVTFTSLPTTP